MERLDAVVQMQCHGVQCKLPSLLMTLDGVSRALPMRSAVEVVFLAHCSLLPNGRASRECRRALGPSDSRPAQSAPDQDRPGLDSSSNYSSMLARGSGLGITTAAPPGSEPVSPRLRLMRRVEQAVTLFSLLLQLALYRRSALTLTARQHAYQALLLALRGICLWVCTCLDLRAWLRYW